MAISPCSRLIVKNLPESVTEEKLRRTFSAKGGELTDVSLKYKNGKFRGFGFVGFKSAEAAAAARDYLDGNYFGALKIRVEFCADRGDPSKPRAWSRHARDSSAYQEAHGVQERKESPKKEKDDSKKKKKKAKASRREEADALLRKYKDDPKFQEFLRVHKRNSESWNDTSVLEVARTFQQEADVGEDGDRSEQIGKEEEGEVEQEQEEEEEEVKVAKDKGMSDLDYLTRLKKGSVSAEDEKVSGKDEKKKEKKWKREPKNEVYHTVKLSGLPYKTKKKDVKVFFRPLRAKSIRVPPKIKGIAYVGFASEADLRKALDKNRSVLKGHRVIVKRYADKSGEGGEEPTDPRWKEQEEALESEETVAESGRIFVRNLCYSATEEDLEGLFGQYGPLSEVNLPVDRMTRKAKGFAFVTYMMPEHAVKAYAELDGKPFQGRMLHLLPGKAKPGEGDDGGEEGTSFKKKKALKEKASAGSSHNWNTLFLGSSAVADVMAKNYSVDKSKVLLETEEEGRRKGSQSAAVRLALGETQLVSETRKFLEEEGFCLEAFEGTATARSKTVMLVKNLPAGVPVEKIRDLFAHHGELGRVVLPPGCVTAVVEFQEPSEARKAFRALAYTRFQNTPLYLEWAPEKALPSTDKVKSEDDDQDRKDKEEAVEKGLVGDGDDDGDDDDATNPPEADTILFVKNLNFDTDEDSLTRHFSSAGRVHSATVSRKRSAKRPGETLSMGYGFVQFRTRAAADAALKTLQHKLLDSHCLELKRSNRAVAADAEEEGRRKRKATNAADKRLEGSKLLVRNVPFQANPSEIEQVRIIISSSSIINLSIYI